MHLLVIDGFDVTAAGGVHQQRRALQWSGAGPEEDNFGGGGAGAVAGPCAGTVLDCAVWGGASE